MLLEWMFTNEQSSHSSDYRHEDTTICPRLLVQQVWPSYFDTGQKLFCRWHCTSFVSATVSFITGDFTSSLLSTFFWTKRTMAKMASWLFYFDTIVMYSIQFVSPNDNFVCKESDCKPFSHNSEWRHLSNEIKVIHTGDWHGENYYGHSTHGGRGEEKTYFFY